MRVDIRTLDLNTLNSNSSIVVAENKELKITNNILITITIVVGLIFIISTINEYQNSKKEPIDVK